MKAKLESPRSGNTTILVVVAVIALIGGGLWLSDTSTKSDQELEVNAGTSSADSNGTAIASAGRYTDYSKQAFADSADKTRVHFFHATWCPTCKAANEDLTSNADQIPENVVVFKTDYDTQTELKKRYGITSQHTFVQVDENGDEVTKWSGGGVAQLAQLIK